MQAQGLPPGVTAIDGGTRGLDMLLTLAEYRRVFIVDAASVGRAPGEWLRLVLRSPRPEGVGSEVEGIAPDLHRLGAETPALSCHAAGLADALTLGAALDVLPEQVIIFGVQPAWVDWSPGLSAEVWKAVPAVGRAILSEIAPVGKPSRGGSLRSTP
jgi:hydrogenase maturation protease